MDEFSLSSVPITSGYETVYRNKDGTYTICPLIAVTFQTFDLGLENERGDCLSVFPKLWDMTRDNIDEVDVDMKGYVGIKYPGETLEEFFTKIKLG